MHRRAESTKSIDRDQAWRNVPGYAGNRKFDSHRGTLLEYMGLRDPISRQMPHSILPLIGHVSSGHKRPIILQNIFT